MLLKIVIDNAVAEPAVLLSKVSVFVEVDQLHILSKSGLVQFDPVLTFSLATQLSPTCPQADSSSLCQGASLGALA